ncbi:MAG: RNA methyltransferase [Anaerolineales bacterium]|nr:RNA methyltransferase [Anaerolineales bacterium]
MITSVANEKVKYVRSLYRRRVRYRERHFVIEGVRLVREAFRAGIVPALLFYGEGIDASPGGGELLVEARKRGLTAFAVSERVMKALADTVSPQGVLAVAPFVELAPPADPTLVLIIDCLRDPGNLGAILRSANAAGVEQVILAPKTVDPYNPKVVRGAMGAHFRLPIVALSWPEIAETVAGIHVLLADARVERAYYEMDWTQPLALIIGGEAHGASREAKELATATVAIPMHGEAESLNAATAASVILFEAARQRSFH